MFRILTNYLVSGKKPLSVFVGVGLGAAVYISTSKNIILLAVKADVIILDTSAGSTYTIFGRTRVNGCVL